jgi:hypothetical protein
MGVHSESAPVTAGHGSTGILSSARDRRTMAARTDSDRDRRRPSQRQSKFKLKLFKVICCRDWLARAGPGRALARPRQWGPGSALSSESQHAAHRVQRAGPLNPVQPENTPASSESPRHPGPDAVTESMFSNILLQSLIRDVIIDLVISG